MSTSSLWRSTGGRDAITLSATPLCSIDHPHQPEAQKTTNPQPPAGERV